LVFTAGGIDLRDTFGYTLGLEDDGLSLKLKVATVPGHQLTRTLADHPRGNAFEKFWRQKTGKELEGTMNSQNRINNLTLADNTMVFSNTYFAIGSHSAMPKVTYITKATHKKAVLNILPVDPRDELWLFDQFFAKRCPRGGTLDCIPPRRGLPSVWTQLLAFTKDPRYTPSTSSNSQSNCN
jgi:hypothetical protein